MPGDNLAIMSLHIAGANTTPVWGMENAERIRRLARQASISTDGSDSERKLWANQAYAFDPLWFRHILAHENLLLTDGHIPILGNVDSAAVDMLDNGTLLTDIERIDIRSNPEIYNDALRKQQNPFCMLLNAENAPKIERESYYGAYKGITDLLTLYLWKDLAFYLTRFAAKLGMTPNMVTAIGAVLCVLTFYLFWQGDYWLGIASGFGFMVLDTVDGKLARCTITSSWWGNIFDHGIDLIHPPFWYFSWAVGLVHWGLGFDEFIFWGMQIALLAGYILQRLIEGEFIRRFGMHIHVWQKFDSDFRLITARRNPNMILLVVGTALMRPDLALWAVTIWTLLSCAVHILRMIQAIILQTKGVKIGSWMQG